MLALLTSIRKWLFLAIMVSASQAFAAPTNTSQQNISYPAIQSAYLTVAQVGIATNDKMLMNWCPQCCCGLTQ